MTEALAPPALSRRDARRRDRRDAILEVAQQSFLEHGYAATTMSAIATMKKIRAAGVADNACFVMITGTQDSAAIVEALKAGADDHVAKPFDFDVLDARLRHLCERAEELGALARHNAELDARIARRAVELGETRDALREMQADRAMLVSSIQALHDEIARLSATRN